MIITDKTFNGKSISYEILDDGYVIYLNEDVWVEQTSLDMPYPELTLRESCLKQIDTIANTFDSDGNVDELFIDRELKGVANGIATLDEVGRIPDKQLGDLDTSLTGGVPPYDVMYLRAEQFGSKLMVSWYDSYDLTVGETVLAKWQGTKIVYKEGSYPINENDGVTVVNNQVWGQYYSIPFELTGLKFNTTYYIQAFPYSTKGVYNTNEVNRISVKLLAPTVYGFHIDSKESDPSNCVTYLEDAIGMTPASMNYSTGVFDYGSWEDAFFMPRPCMLKYSGTVDYYLDPNDYTKKEDGTPSDIANINYGGNAMMEWGRDGEQIWMKIVPDASDNTSYSVYISNMQVDSDYHAWSFINSKGELGMHFYTAIYTGGWDTENNGYRLRSLSGMSNAKERSHQTDINRALLNNLDSSNVQWYIETYADRILINMLSVLMGKSLDTQTVYGYGHCDDITMVSDTAYTSYPINTGTMNQKGLFWGSNKTVDTTEGVKVFGMENWWGNISRACAGLIIVQGQMKIKLTYGTQDGSTGTGYNTTGDGYINVGTPITASSNGYMRTQVASSDGYIYPLHTSGGSNSTYYCDYFYSRYDSTYCAESGGVCNTKTACGAFTIDLTTYYEYAGNYSGVALSCRP